MARSTTTADDSTTKANTEDLSRQIDALKTDINAISETLTGLAKTRGEELSASARKRLYDVKAQGDAQVAELNARATELGVQAGEFVHRKPGMALGFAAGFGFLAGLMMTSRRH